MAVQQVAVAEGQKLITDTTQGTVAVQAVVQDAQVQDVVVVVVATNQRTTCGLLLGWRDIGTIGSRSLVSSGRKSTITKIRSVSRRNSILKQVQ